MFLIGNLHSQSIENSLKTIVIDPGHGGKDPGTLGTKRYKKYEKDIALDVSLILGKYIKENFPEINVVYTRKSDVFLQLWERTEIANKLDADLFISIHCDGYDNSSASGASVFVMGMSKLKANMDVAIRENSVMYLEDNFKEKYDGFDPKSPESYIVFSLMQNTYLEQSISFAQQVDKQFVERANRKSRGVKQAPFYVISRTDMPSVLIELGFLTNPLEEDFLNSKKGKIYLASAIFRAFRDYKLEIEGSVDDLNIEDSTFNSMSFDSSSLVRDSIVYKIQLGTYKNSMKNSPIFTNIDFEEIFEDGIYKYITFGTNDKIVADQMKYKLRSKSFPGAFIIAFYKGNRISVKEALDLQKKIKL